MCETKGLRQILSEAEVSTCDELIELQIAITMLSINPERAAAAMQNIMTLHLEGGFCDQSDGHAKAREIFAPPDR